MTLGAFELGVASPQLVTSHLMVKVRNFPIVLSVAGGALAVSETTRESGSVNIFMAGQALGGF